MSSTCDNIVEKMFEPTFENALSWMRKSIMLHCTKNGEPFSPVTIEYLRKEKNESAPFIKPELLEKFFSEFLAAFQLPAPLNLFEASNFKNSLEVMRLLTESTDWNKIHNLLQEQNHSKKTFEDLLRIVYQFSPHGYDFIYHLQEFDENEFYTA